MKRLLCVAIAICIVLISCDSISFAQSAPSNNADRCKKPIILEILPSGSVSEYRLNGKSSTVYPLTEMANALQGCKVERTVDVILDYHVSLADFLGAVPSKLQAESVRYFIRTETSLVEVSIISYDVKLPREQ